MLCVCVCGCVRGCLCVCNTHHPAGVQGWDPVANMLTTLSMKNILHEKYLTQTTHTVLPLRAAGLEWPRHELTPRALLNLISWRRPSSSHSTQCEWKTAREKQVLLEKPKQKWVRKTKRVGLRFGRVLWWLSLYQLAALATGLQHRSLTVQQQVSLVECYVSKKQHGASHTIFHSYSMSQGPVIRLKDNVLWRSLEHMQWAERRNFV